jgi:hypothetical protein
MKIKQIMAFYYRLDPLELKEIQMEIKGISVDIFFLSHHKKSFIKTRYSPVKVQASHTLVLVRVDIDTLFCTNIKVCILF